MPGLDPGISCPPALAVRRGDRRIKSGDDGVGVGATAPREHRLFPALLLAALLLAAPAWAISDPSEALPDSHQEARAVAIGQQLRCLVCQNESIEDSGADLARDLRKIVRQQVTAGKTDQQVIEWLVARYGNFVRLSPPIEAGTVLLWASPVLALLAGGVAVWFARRSPPPPPLSEAEQTRLRALLDT